MKDFQIAGGTVRGRDHTRAGRNNQDAYHWIDDPDLFVAVVCDGCGSEGHSEAGALLGSRMLTEIIYSQMRRHQEVNVERIRQSIASRLATMADWMGESRSKVVSNFFLFTSIILVMDPKLTIVIGCGDGAYSINEELITIDMNNVPSYPGYAVTNDSEPEMSQFIVHEVRDTPEVDKVLIATDGMSDFEKAQERNIPGKKEKVGSYKQFWSDKYFKNSFAVIRRLNLINRSTRRIDYENEKVDDCVGLLPDDTTLVTVRRCKST